MTLAAVLAIAVCLLFAAVGPALGRRLPPAAATRLLVIGSVAAAATTLFVLAVVAFVRIGEVPLIAAIGSWSTEVLRRDSPIPDIVTAASAGLLTILTVRAAAVALRRTRALLAVHRDCRHLSGAGPIVVVNDDRPDAFTTPDPRGRIVVTTGLVRALDPLERRVVLAHERSHLQHRHPWWVLAADLAAAANPLLTPTAKAVDHAVERWADEDAAAITGRRVTARTLARAGLLRHRHAALGPALGVVSADLPGRVRALLEPPPRSRPLTTTTLLALILTCALSAVAVQHLGERLFERAGAAHHSAAAAVAGVEPASGP
jgi:hypothetical protein